VDTHDDRQVVALARCAEEHLAGTGGQVLVGTVPRGEAPGGLDDELDAAVAPAELGRVPLGQDVDPPAADDERAAVDLDVVLERAVRRVVTEQVGEGLGVCQVVDRDDLQVAPALERGAEEAASDAAEAVDADAHDAHPSLLVGGGSACTTAGCTAARPRRGTRPRNATVGRVATRRMSERADAALSPAAGAPRASCRRR